MYQRLPEPRTRKYADVSIAGVAHITTIYARLPFLVLWLCAKNLLFHRKTFKRTTANAVIRWFNEKFSVAEMQYITSSSLDSYKQWAQTSGLPIHVEDLVDDTKIMWIGKKRSDKVVLYFHGGAYLSPLLDFPLAFWQYVQQELSKQDCDVGFAVLGYSLIPTAAFPTQLRQATVAVEHLIHTGLEPKNLHIVGDSAGGNLILALLSHILHPLPGIPKLRFPSNVSSRLGSVYMMSPWVILDSNSTSFLSDSPEEMFSTANARHFGQLFLECGNIDDELRPYVEPLKAPAGWFKDLGTAVGRALITVGDKELFLDDIVEFKKVLEIEAPKPSLKLTLLTQDGGVHNDPLMDFFVKLPHDRLGTLTPAIIEWLADGIKESAAAGR